MKEKVKKLKSIIEGYKRLGVAFSGGCDSAFLLDFANKILGKNLLAISLILRGLTKEEKDLMQGFCKERGIRHILIEINELEIPGFAENPKDRCYICKKYIFSRVKEIAVSEGIDVIADGSNYDDLSDYRPGMKALSELGVESPLLMAELTKPEIRSLSKEAGLPTWDLPSSPCLSSRIPYNETITLKKLEMIGEGERILKNMGFSVCRVRCHNGDVAKLEVDIKKLPELSPKKDEISAALKNIGFKEIIVDEEGFRSGKLNTL